MNTSSRLITFAAVAAALACGRADAAAKYWAGTGTWNSTNANWGTATGGPYTSTWSNAAPDAATFEGTAGTVTLAMTATANGMTFSTTGYTITGGTLAFTGTTTVATSVTGTIESKLTGAGALTKSGAGVLRLTNTANDFTGTITASGGVLEMALIPNASNRIAFTAGTLRYVGATNTTTNRAIQVSTLSGIQARLESSGVGTINYSSSAAATASGIPQAGAGLRLGGSNTGDNFWRGTLNDISTIPLVLNKIDAGTWIVTGNSGYTGGTTINSGTLGFGSMTALGTGTVSFSGNATLRATVSGTLANIMSTGASSAVTATIDTQANAISLSGSIGGSGNLAKLGTATLTLTSANNAYTGLTTISAGTLALSGGGSIASSTGLNLSGAAAAFDISAAAGGRTVKALEGAAGSSIALGGNTLTADNATAVTFGGVISGSGGFTKAGGGSLTLSAEQTFTGAVRVDSGTLAIGGANTLAAASRMFVAQSATLDATTAGITVGDGQTLGGYGTVSGGVTLAPGAIVSPGGSIGTFTIDGGLAWSGTSAYQFEITSAVTGTTPGTDWDLLTATSLAILSTPENPFRILLTSLTSGTDQTPGSMGGNWNPTSDYEWLFVTTGSTISTFDPTLFTIDQANFDPYNDATNGTFSVVRGDSLGRSDTDLYIVYTPVPEPATLTLATICLAAVAWAASRGCRIHSFSGKASVHQSTSTAC